MLFHERRPASVTEKKMQGPEEGEATYKQTGVIESKINHLMSTPHSRSPSSLVLLYQVIGSAPGSCAACYHH